ncbi:hypothetical protein GHT06_016987 [Daphnia sinensis]|uniref:FLYWCH-type domain-containing protein n=1 Tax=Daphnia sinensis TaxID=1820382 RepID=A0AAD5KPA4_9CRUS|nr:hypothetical protein GHT06_016987 [Daphnia sinensis]
MERFRLISGARSDSNVVINSLDKFIFHRNGVVRGSTRYRCSRYLTRRCTASLICNEQGIFSPSGFHNHENDEVLIIKFEFMDWCRKQAANTNIPLHTIYMSALRRFPGRPPVQFVAIRSTVYRARQQNVPVNPSNAQHFADLINSNQRYRYVCHLGLAQNYRLNDQIKRLVKMAIAIALLHPNDALFSLNRCIAELRNYANEVNDAIDAETRVRVHQFVQYIRSFWMERIGPQRFCVNMDTNRTNNQMEANHRSFNDHVGNPHPNPWYFLDRLQEFGQEAEYRYLALRDGTPVRDRRRQEYTTRDREIRTLQTNLQNGRINIREFLMAAAYRFEPVEVVFPEHNAEELIRPLDEVRAAFEALLHVPQVVVEAPDAGVPADELVEIEVILGAENQMEIAAVVDPVAAVARGRGRGRPPEQIRDGNDQLAVVDPVADNRRERGRPRGRPARARQAVEGAVLEGAVIVDPGAVRNERRGAERGRRYTRHIAPVDPNLEAEDSTEEDGDNRVQRFFVAQQANFLNRRANVMARFHEQRQLRQLEVVQQLGELDEDLPLADVVQQQENLPQQYPDVNHDGQCPVSLFRMQNTILNCGHILCPVCHSPFNNHRPLHPNRVNVANNLLEPGNQQ